MLHTPGNMIKHGWFVLRLKWNCEGMRRLENSGPLKGNENKSAITGTYFDIFHTFLDTILWGFARLCINTAPLPAHKIQYLPQKNMWHPPTWRSMLTGRTSSALGVTVKRISGKSIGWKNGWNSHFSPWLRDSFRVPANNLKHKPFHK